jgi:type II restriction enzyme
VRLTFDASLAAGYTSGSQRARRLSEGWFASEMYCAACGADSVQPHPNNTRANDFHCLACGAQFELKSGKGAFGPTIPDGAFASMMERIERQGGGPHLALLRYCPKALAVRDMLLVPGPFLTPDVIRPRRALAASARRAGWVGCNIRIADIPAAGRIAIVRDGAPISRAAVVAGPQRAAAATGDLTARSWFVDTLRCVERLGPEFTLSEVYAFEAELRARHPKNRHIKEKLRQQLQRMRNAGLVVFLGGARYRRVEG